MLCHTTNPPALDTLRQEIDALDDAMIALAERRTALARKIARAKQSDPAIAPIRPDREEQVIHRLASKSTLPQGSVATLWRELMALGLQVQRRTDIVIHASRDAAGTTARAAARFGAAAPIVSAPSAEAALARARAGNAIAVVELDDEAPWWLALPKDGILRIIGELKGTGGQPPALAIARIDDAHLAKERRWEVIPEAELDARVQYGETVCAIARSAGMVLCMVDDLASQMRGAA